MIWITVSFLAVSAIWGVTDAAGVTTMHEIDCLAVYAKHGVGVVINRAISVSWHVHGPMQGHSLLKMTGISWVFQNWSG